MLAGSFWGSVTPRRVNPAIRSAPVGASSVPKGGGIPQRLRKEEVVTIHLLAEKGESRIALTLGVSEGTVRYHLGRAREEDGRRWQPRRAERVVEVIAAAALAISRGKMRS